jgi:predicted metal-dependent peptidase
MAETNDLRQLSIRLTSLRADLLNSFPFFGRLLLHLQFGYASCGTAFTDMRKIVFDPGFAARLSDEEVRFVLLHEVMHCVLHHCTRGQSLHQELYNIACDIVVNSLIMEILHTDLFCVEDEQVMHLAPDGKEGREYSAEKVYEMLIRSSEEQLVELYGEGFRDLHDRWTSIDAAQADDIWEQHIRSAAKAAGTGSGIPYGMRRYLKEVENLPTMNWKQILHDFIQHDKSDFVYEHPDHRYQGDLIMPSFQENEYGDHVEKLWFFIDTSGSISDETLSEAFLHIKEAIEQMDSLSGELAFFDSEVSSFYSFHSLNDLTSIEPVGGGGTSFDVIFEQLGNQTQNKENPAAILIMTDGLAAFPNEKAAKGIPVLWIIIGSEIVPPWGVSINV